MWAYDAKIIKKKVSLKIHQKLYDELDHTCAVCDAKSDKLVSCLIDEGFDANLCEECAQDLAHKCDLCGNLVYADFIYSDQDDCYADVTCEFCRRA